MRLKDCYLVRESLFHAVFLDLLRRLLSPILDNVWYTRELHHFSVIVHLAV